jgi:DNA topoisomerase VI subunit A
MKEREHLLNTTDEHLLYVCEELVRNFSKTSDMEGRLQHLEILWILVNRLRVATVGAVEDYYYDSEEVDRETRKSFFRFWLEDRGLKTDLKYK